MKNSVGRQEARRKDEHGRATDKVTGKASLQKGGVPAAPSGTATLLRLSPNHESHLRRLPPANWLGHRLRVLPTFMT